MKKLLFFILMIPGFIYSQEQDEIETVFGNEIEHGGYGGPEIKFTPVGNELGILVGGKGGWILNSTISVGGAIWGFVSDHDVYHNFDKVDKAYLRGGWGGFYCEYIHNSNDLIHLTANLFVGGGGLAYTGTLKDLFNYEYSEDWIVEQTNFFVLEPGLNADINFTSFFRLSFGVSYRYTSGVHLTKHKDSDLSGVSGNLCFKFGSF